MGKISLILIRETWSHMAAVSGYDPLFAAIQESEGVITKNLFVPLKNPRLTLGKKILSKVGLFSPAPSPTSPSPFTEPRHELLAQAAIEQAAKQSDALIILSAAENQYGGWFASSSPEIRKRIVLCMHQPPAWMRLHWRDFSALNGLKGLICLCKEQQDFLQSVCDTPVHLSRHGACLDFFKPGSPVAAGPPRLLFVGQWLRDFETLSRTMPLIWQAMPEVRLDCVVPRSARDHSSLLLLAGDSRVSWHAGISAEELLQLYQGSALLLLPLIDATANNAIVEALSCGLPIVSSDVGGILEYVPADCGVLAERGRSEAHAAGVVQFLSDATSRQDASFRCREFAENKLAWKQIAADLIAAF